MFTNAPLPTQGLYVVAFAGQTPVAQADGVVLASAARGVASYTSGEYFNPNRLGVRLLINVSVNNGGTLTGKIQVFDEASQTWTDLAGANIGAGVTTNIMTTLTVYPGVTETATAPTFDVASPLGARWRTVFTVATATMTFSVGGEYLA